MIPLRVYLKYLLCHREQEFVIDGHPVWLLHGPNGVGKSAVFDAMVYALLDCSPQIRKPHLTAALALWRYCEQSAHWIFGSSTGDRNADKILSAMRKEFGGHDEKTG